ncbi:DUF1684 domain-containing protein [Asanoa sp. NPDC049573]|uniref:DUF1684 domain-containing protein n=1 Tax=Asanoa sp. NPDC049573 TaxID=3155396 RepID=UPI00342B1ABA
MPSSSAPPAAVDRARASWPRWRDARLSRVTAPMGNLALVETIWGARVEDHPGSVPIERRDRRTGAVDHGVRRFDADSPANRHFAGIDVYPFDPAWVIEARFVAHDPPRLVAFEHLRDNGLTRDLAVPGDILFTLDGVDYAFDAFDDDGTLLLVFGDRTNGVETYASGRFLFVPRAPGDDRVVLDFNRAFVPPCGFSGQYNCPMPPRQNRFGLAVRAGEKLPLFRDGFQVH